MKINKKKNYLFLALFLCFLGLFLKIVFVWKNSVFFTYDQGRDLLEVRRIWLLKRPSLIGPTTSLHGVFCGPFWYWLILPFFLLTAGHPLSSILPLWGLSFLVPLLFFFLLKDKKLGLLLTAVFSFDPVFFKSANHALNSHPLVYLLPLVLLLLAKFVSSERRIFLFWVYFLISSGFHFNVVVTSFLLAAFGVTILVFRKAGLLWRHKRASWGFVIPFLPQLLFEVRHQFLQSKTILELIGGDSGSLSLAGMTFARQIKDRFQVWLTLFRESAGESRFWLGAFLFLIATSFLFWLRRKKKAGDEVDDLFLISLVSGLVILLCVLLFPFAFWPWYFGSVKAGMTWFIFASLGWLAVRKPVWKKVVYPLVLGWLFLRVLSLNPWPLKQELSADPSNLRLRQAVIEKIYQDAAGRGMKVYTFAPNVYDYPYQYLIWYRAKAQKSYLPKEYFYLPDQPEYVPAKEPADSLIESRSAQAIYLIIEPFESQGDWFQKWRGNFGPAIEVWQVGGVRIEKI